MNHHWLRIAGALLLFCLVLFTLLIIPETTPVAPSFAGDHAFAWNQDDRWIALENLFSSLRSKAVSRIADEYAVRFAREESLLEEGEHQTLDPDAPYFNDIEETTFTLAPYSANLPGKVQEYISVVDRLRKMIKNQSLAWDIGKKSARDRLYRLLYGSRMALEEILLQTPPSSVPALLPATDEPSRTPSDTMFGITIHSGDLLVSRGGFPTSALIARGNDYQGNYSHVALVHIDPQTRRTSIIESHIERGVTVSTVKEYLADTKMRLMILRLRADLPVLKNDPLLPHKAASDMLRRALENHIPYDFSLDYRDTTKMFCSEVASASYRKFGVNLWTGLSHLSRPGVRAWLAAFGATHFETQEPSDLEYDPQLSVVAEWRDPALLFKDHIDNAVIDAMLEEADRGRTLSTPWYDLPAARIAKLYSILTNFNGGTGPIPEGMSAGAALRNQEFSSEHRSAVEQVRGMAGDFRSKTGYTPPYWELLAMARKAL